MSKRKRPPRSSEPERERALIVGVYNYGEPYMQQNLDEFEKLCEAVNLEVVHTHLQKINKSHPKFFIGPGRVEALNDVIKEKDIDVVLLDCQLAPRHERNLEEVFKRKVLDRTALILDIFARNAKTKQAKLQVELAQLKYTRTRLAHLWGHLDRYGGGGVGTRGPGEQQLEVDRRLIDKRIQLLENSGKQLQERTKLQNKTRDKSFNVSLVGYTNAGKSSLLNRLTDADVFVKDQLFATLDTRTRFLAKTQDGRDILISDTVGFIRRLPHALVDSFHATLEEAMHADLLLHVVDASDEGMLPQMESVEGVLDGIGAGDSQVVMVFNKLDKVKEREILDQRASDYHNHVMVSAKNGTGCENLLNLIRRLAKEAKLAKEKKTAL